MSAVQRAYWTPKELKEYTGVSLSLIYKWVDENKIPYNKPNGKIMFNIETTKRWLESKTVKPRNYSV